MALTEKTYTLINEDEVMVDFTDDGKASIVYVYVDSKPSTFRWLGIDAADITPELLGRYHTAGWRTVTIDGTCWTCGRHFAHVKRWEEHTAANPGHRRLELIAERPT